jgi:hypothetical protein
MYGNEYLDAFLDARAKSAAAKAAQAPQAATDGTVSATAAAEPAAAAAAAAVQQRLAAAADNMFVRSTKIIESMDNKCVMIDPAGEAFIRDEKAYKGGRFSGALYEKLFGENHIDNNITHELSPIEAGNAKYNPEFVPNKHGIPALLIHTVGPDIRKLRNDFEEFKKLLTKALEKTADLIMSYKDELPENAYIALPLISGGIFRDKIPLEKYMNFYIPEVKRIFAYLEMKVHIQLYTREEQEAFKKVYVSSPLSTAKAPAPAPVSSNMEYQTFIDASNKFKFINNLLLNGNIDYMDDPGFFNHNFINYNNNLNEIIKNLHDKIITETEDKKIYFLEDYSLFEEDSSSKLFNKKLIDLIGDNLYGDGNGNLSSTKDSYDDRNILNPDNFDKFIQHGADSARKRLVDHYKFEYSCCFIDLLTKKKDNNFFEELNNFM